VVSGSLEPGAGSGDYRDDGVEGAQEGGDIGGGGGDNARIQSTDYADSRRLKKAQESTDYVGLRRLEKR
jgi:hypothetical protein